MACDIRIGTSGWHYRHWLGTFYPDDLPANRMLGYYLERFDTVELNNSFYHLPSEGALDQWRETVPDDFLFAAKGSRFLTHMKKLKDPEPGVARFFERIDRLRPKLGPVLFQLPPRWRANPERLDEFLRVLPRGHRYSFELRDPSWLVPEIYDVLRKHGAAYCIYELAGFVSPFELTAPFTYVRLHGPGGKYQGSYDHSALRWWSRKIREWSKSLDGVYLYFDNDEAGFAARDALRLRELVGIGSPSRGDRKNEREARDERRTS